MLHRLTECRDVSFALQAAGEPSQWGDEVKPNQRQRIHRLGNPMDRGAFKKIIRDFFITLNCPLHIPLSPRRRLDSLASTNSPACTGNS